VDKPVFTLFRTFSNLVYVSHKVHSMDTFYDIESKLIDFRGILKCDHRNNLFCINFVESTVNSDRSGKLRSKYHAP
jgi:hypothetical protein